MAKKTKEQETKKVVDEKAKTPKAQESDYFASAPTADKKAASKAAKEQGDDVEFSQDYHTLVNLKILEKAIKGQTERLKSSYDEMAYEIFQERCKELGKKPEAFKAIAGNASAKYRLQSPTHGFPEAIAQELSQKGIDYEAVDKEFRINPEVLQNKEYRAILGAALKNIKELEGVQIIEAVRTYKPNEATYVGIAKIEDGAEQKRLIEKVSTLYFVDHTLDGSANALEAALDNLAHVGILPKRK